ncbi:NB-ARC - like 10 [Theobroma cacao]|nr:NB-ARC - like 10 [Theobroma cacao]
MPLCTSRMLTHLRGTLRTIHTIILDAEKKQESDNIVKEWISWLEGVVYDADDLVDEFDYEILRQKVLARRQVRNFFSSSNPLAYSLKMGPRIKDIRERLDAVAADMAMFNLRGRVVELEAKNTYRETGSKEESEIIGREEHKQSIIASLLQEQNDYHGSIVVIVGFGGLGKTSLAQLVFKDAKVEKFFDRRIWVNVHEEFDVCKIFNKILRSLGGSEVDELDLDLVRRQLEKVLKGLKYLLVLDDLWKEDIGWDNFTKYMVFGSPKSKILVTTRNKDVASNMGVKHPYILKSLNEDHSWALFEQVTFKGQPQIDTELTVIAKDITRRCKGVPLAIKSLGGLMRQKPKEYWFSVQENEIWKFFKEKDIVLSVLRLSYIHLPRHLKQCFSFCSIFPKDFKMSKDLLIKSWRAQGYIQGMGEKDFNELLSKSFFQEEEKDDYGNIISCQMHGLIHDLALSVAESSFYLMKDEHAEVPRGVRHVLLEKFSKEVVLALSKTKGIRTINFSCKSLKELPRDTWQLISLEYLGIDGCDDLKCLPKGLGKLTSLQRLQRFIVNSVKKGFSGAATLNELRDLNDLGNYLSIENLDMVRNVELESMETNLKGKKRLQSLQLGWKDSASRDYRKDELLLDNLQPHHYLKELSVYGYEGAKFSRWLSYLKNLVKIHIYKSWNFQHVVTLPPLDELSSLQSITLEDLPLLEHVADGMGDHPSFPSHCFQSLQQLEIRNCPKLNGWWRTRNENQGSTAELPWFPCLSKLKIINCPKLTSMPLFPSVDQELSLEHTSIRPLRQTLKMKITKETASKVRSELIIGREKDKELIIESLLKKQNDRHGDIIPIVAIVGFGGLGKTSLAQLVYNDAKVESYFQRRIWVCVSEEFNVGIIFKKILESLEGDKVNDLCLDIYVDKLQEKLKGKKYLLVLDDVWNENNLEWDKFSQYLVFGASGSKILVTTRNKTVSSTMGVHDPYLLKGLNEDQSWALFNRVAFQGQDQIDSDLRVIGEDVARKCKGVPLALKCLGGLMRQKPNKNYWLSVQENGIWKILEKDDSIFPVLQLSYIHLPRHLKQCFVFCSLFPKDFKISKAKLIQSWRAQGYIQLMENENVQDIGDEYFNDLLSRSFFQEEEKDAYGNIICCKMHDLIHDLALLVKGHHFHWMKDEKEKISKRARHVSSKTNSK